MRERLYSAHRPNRRARSLAVILAALGVLWALPVELAAQNPPPTPPGQGKKPKEEPSPAPEPEPLPEPEPAPGPAPAPPPDAAPAPGSNEDKGGGGGSSPGVTSPGSGGQSRSPRGRHKGDCASALSGRIGGGPDLGPPNSTDRLVSILSPLEPRGITLARALRRVAGPFPVAGEATWANDWHAARCNPSPHLHQGIDIFARAGTPLVAVAVARITQKGVGAVSGLKVEITADDGTEYFYAHLSGFAPGLSLGQRVEPGDTIGYMGTSGNAEGTSPHVHFEVQPHGIAVPPKPYVDRWIAAAERRAQRWVRSIRKGVAPSPGYLTSQRGTDATRLSTLLDPFLATYPEPSWGLATGSLRASSSSPPWASTVVLAALALAAASAAAGGSRRRFGAPRRVRSSP